MRISVSFKPTAASSPSPAVLRNCLAREMLRWNIPALAIASVSGVYLGDLEKFLDPRRKKNARRFEATPEWLTRVRVGLMTLVRQRALAYLAAWYPDQEEARMAAAKAVRTGLPDQSHVALAALDEAAA